MVVEIMRDEHAFMPVKAHKTDAGYDLKTPKRVFLQAHSKVAIDTGVHMLIPEGYVGMIKSKSGLNVKHNIICEGVVDAGYTGSIVAMMYNLGDEPYMFEIGDKITQIVIMPIADVSLVEVWNMEETDRGSNGFGSSGK